MRRQDGTLAVTETNRVALATADSTKNDGVTILEELANLTAWKCDLFLALPAELEERTVLVLFGARDCACSKHITNVQVATSHGVVSNRLRNTVIQVTHV